MKIWHGLVQDYAFKRNIIRHELFEFWAFRTSGGGEEEVVHDVKLRDTNSIIVPSAEITKAPMAIPIDILAYFRAC